VLVVHAQLSSGASVVDTVVLVLVLVLVLDPVLVLELVLVLVLELVLVSVAMHDTTSSQAPLSKLNLAQLKSNSYSQLSSQYASASHRLCSAAVQGRPWQSTHSPTMQW
jgi:hypothetical protein